MTPATTRIHEALRALRDEVRDDANLVFTPYDSAAEARAALTAYLARLEAGDASAVKELGVEVLPTSFWNELAVSAGISEAFERLAQAVEATHARPAADSAPATTPRSLSRRDRSGLALARVELTSRGLRWSVEVTTQSGADDDRMELQSLEAYRRDGPPSFVANVFDAEDLAELEALLGARTR